MQSLSMTQSTLWEQLVGLLFDVGIGMPDLGVAIRWPATGEATLASRLHFEKGRPSTPSQHTPRSRVVPLRTAQGPHIAVRHTWRTLDCKFPPVACSYSLFAAPYKRECVPTPTEQREPQCRLTPPESLCSLTASTVSLQYKKSERSTSAGERPRPAPSWPRPAGMATDSKIGNKRSGREAGGRQVAHLADFRR
jgi:hypothetical protein